jgi:hypothetical protein
MLQQRQIKVLTFSWDKYTKKYSNKKAPMGIGAYGHFVGSTPRTKNERISAKISYIHINIYDFTKNQNIYTNFLKIFS